MNPTIPPPPPPPPPYGMPPYQGPPGQYHVHHTGGCAGMVQSGCRVFALLAVVALVLVGFGCWSVNRRTEIRHEKAADWATQRISVSQDFVRSRYPGAVRVDFFNMEVPPETANASSVKLTFTAWLSGNYAERNRLFFLWDREKRLKEVYAIWSEDKFFPLREYPDKQESKEVLPGKDGVSRKALAWLQEQAKGRYEMREMKWEALICPNVYACTVSFETVDPDGKATPQKFRFVVDRRSDEMVAVDNLLTGKSFLRSDNPDHITNAKYQVPDFVP